MGLDWLLIERFNAFTKHLSVRAWWWSHKTKFLLRGVFVTLHYFCQAFEYSTNTSVQPKHKSAANDSRPIVLLRTDNTTYPSFFLKNFTGKSKTVNINCLLIGSSTYQSINKSFYYANSPWSSLAIIFKVNVRCISLDAIRPVYHGVLESVSGITDCSANNTQSI